MADIASCLSTLELENFESKSFIPFNELRKLFTRNRVDMLLRQHDIEGYLIGSIVDQVLAGGLRTFAVLGAVQAIGSITRFIREDQFSEVSLDAKLPLKDTDIPRYFPNSDKGELFLRRQWSFLAPVFSENRSCPVLDDRTILPFLHSRLIGEDGFASVCRITVDASHYISNTSIKVSTPTILEKTQHQSKSTQPLKLIWKQVIKRPRDEETLVRAFHDEVSILFALRCLQHPNIIRLITAFSKGTTYSFLFPVADGDLGELLRTDRRLPGFQTEADIYGSLWGLSSALDAVHNLSVLGPDIQQIDCHGDIRPSQILFHNGRLILSGFWYSAQRMAKDSHGVGGCCTSYSAPECEDLETFEPGRIDRKSDIWSLGCVLAEILAYLSVEPAKGPTAVQEFTKDRELKFGSFILSSFFGHKETNPGVQRLLERCKQNLSGGLRSLARIVDKILQFDPDQRPSAADITRLLFHLTQQTRFSMIKSAFGSDVEQLDSDLEIELERARIWSKAVGLQTDSMTVLESTWFATNHSFKEYDNLQLLLTKIETEIATVVLESQKTASGQPASHLYKRLRELMDQLWDCQPFAVRRDMYGWLEETMLSKYSGGQMQEALGFVRGSPTEVAKSASTLGIQGRRKEAAKLQYRMLETKKRVLGEERLDAVSLVNNVENTLSNQDSEEADSTGTENSNLEIGSISSKSSVSSYTNDGLVMTTLDEVTEIFMNDEELCNIFAEVFTKYGQGKALRNGVRLLMWLGRRLVEIAKTPAEKAAARFFMSRKYDFALIRTIETRVSKNDAREQTSEQPVQSSIKQERLEKYLQDLPQTSPIDTQIVKTIDWRGNESESSSDSENEEEEIKETGQQNIATLKLFLQSSDAFMRFKEELNDFNRPLKNEVMWKKKLWFGRQQVYFELPNMESRLTRMDDIKLLLGSKLGQPIQWWPLKQPRRRLLSTEVRMIFLCNCGLETFIDISYAKARKYRQICSTAPMQEATGQSTPLPVHEASAADSSNCGNHKATGSNLLGKAVNNLRESFTKMKLPPRESQELEENTAIASHSNPPPSYIHWCVDAAPQRTLLHQICIEEQKGKAFLDELYRSYKKLRGWRWYFSMMTCAEIRLVNHMRVHEPENRVVKCGCEKSEVLPNQDERTCYAYHIHPPNLDEEHHVQLAEQALIQYYHGYEECHHAMARFDKLLLGIPHRVNGASLGFKGYGIMARQGWTLPRLAAFALITQGWAMVFVVLWLFYHPGDLQNAFAPAMYSLSLVAVFVAIPDVFRS